MVDLKADMKVLSWECSLVVLLAVYSVEKKAKRREESLASKRGTKWDRIRKLSCLEMERMFFHSHRKCMKFVLDWAEHFLGGFEYKMRN